MQTIRLSDWAVKPDEIVLDIGCGQGRHLHALRALGVKNCFGLDLSKEDLHIARSGFTTLSEASPVNNNVFIQGDTLTLPFDDTSFDKVICSEVLEHIPDYNSAVAEINRVLKPGGELAVSVPRRWPEQVCWLLEKNYHQTPGGHVRIFNWKTLRRDIEKAKPLTFEKKHWAHGLHSPYWWLQCAFWNRRETLWLIRQYHRLLVWDMMKRPPLLRFIENRLLDPIMGKSIVLYFKRALVHECRPRRTPPNGHIGQANFTGPATVRGHSMV